MLYICGNFKKKTMKKITLLAATLVAITFASCKKDRTCTCTTTSVYTDPTGTTTDVETDKTVITKVSKGTARVNCLSTKQTFSYTYFGVTTNVVSTNDCKLD